MKTLSLFITLLITLFLTNNALAQVPEEPPPPPPVEKMPEFKGGEKKRIKYIQKNLKYPKEAYKAKMGGTSYITFVVEKDGSISSVQLLKLNKGCPPCDEEAIRVAKAMPKWIPGELDGKKVRVQFTMPIKFTPKQ